MSKTQRLWRTILAIVLLLPIFVVGNPATFAQPAPSINPVIKAVYDVTEFPLLAGQVSRSWIWGPEAFNSNLGEPYADSSNSRREVYYFDKGRLELNNPANRTVTAGLLAKELMTGEVQVGDAQFTKKGPSSTSVAGDFDDLNAPTYADLGLLFDKPAISVGTVITGFIRADGTQSGVASLASYNVTAEEFRPGYKHTIASVFKDFLNSETVVYKNDAFVRGKLFETDSYDAGLPLTEPYWARAKVAGKVQDVLVQGFERRVLSYTPGNPVEFRVETGNVGRHYYSWRYEVTEVQLLGINDFHGRLLPETVNNAPRGGAAFITSKVNQLRDANPNTWLIHAGDSIGATQLQSALLQDEPAVEVYNLMRFDAGSVGNHEFDKGLNEAIRMVKGGKNPVRGNEWGGAKFPYLVSNLEYRDTGKPPFDPYVIIEKNGIKVAIIGAVTKDLPILVSPSGIASLRVLPEAEGINKYIPEIKSKNPDLIVVAIHEGGTPSVADGEVRVTGPIVNIAAQVDPAVDVIISGHTHQDYVTYLSGKLVTQSGFYTRNVSSLRIQLDKNKKVVLKRAATVPVLNNEITPNAEVQAIVDRAVRESAPVANRKISSTAVEITRTQNTAGESALGNLIADAQRDVMKTDFSFMNPGGIRSNQPAGDITYGSLFTIQPFGNIMIKAEMTGDQVYRLLEQQWQANNIIRFLQISGLSYTWDNSKPNGSRIVEIRTPNGQPIDRAKTYTVAMNNFLSDGGDAFSVFTEAKNKVGGPIDLDALIDYIQRQTDPIPVPTVGNRIIRLN
jgi:5'-nucleotidase